MTTAANSTSDRPGGGNRLSGGQVLCPAAEQVVSEALANSWAPDQGELEILYQYQNSSLPMPERKVLYPCD
jgi:hypothetical protein